VIPDVTFPELQDRAFLVAAPLRMTDLYSWPELLTLIAVMRVGDFVTVERVPDYRARSR
jgi:hypothetical protein